MGFKFLLLLRDFEKNNLKKILKVGFKIKFIN